MSRRPKKKFSWLVFAASMVGTMAVALSAVGTWFWFTRVSQGISPEFRERIMNLWVLAAISLMLIALGLYLLPRKHARWLSPIQKGVVLALLAHVILVLVTRLASISTNLAVESRPRAPSIQLKSAHEVKVSLAIRKQFADLPIRDPTLVRTAKAEPPRPKQVRPRAADAAVPQAQARPKPLQMEAVRRKTARSTEQAVTVAPKMQMQLPRPQMRRQNPLNQPEERPTAEQRPKLSRTPAPRPTASAQPHQQQPRGAQAQPRRITPTLRAWQVRTVAEASIKPTAEVTVRRVQTQLAGADSHVAVSEQRVGSTGREEPATGARLALDAAGSPGRTRTLELASVPAEVRGSSLTAPAGRVRSPMATIVEQAVAARTEGLLGTRLSIAGEPGSAPAGQPGFGEPGKQPSGSEAAGPRPGGTRLVETGVAGMSRGAGDLGAGILVVPTRGTGESVAVAAATGGGRRGRELGRSAQPSLGIPATIRDGPELTGPGGKGRGPIGGGPAAASAAPSPGAPQARAASGRTYAGRQKTGSPGGSFAGNIAPGGASAGRSVLGKPGSLLASAPETGRRGTGNVAGGDRVGVNVSSPAGTPQLGAVFGPVVARRDREGSPATAVGGPGLHAGPVAVGGHGARQAQQVAQVASAPAAGLADPAPIASRGGAAERPLPPGEVFVRLMPLAPTRDLKLEPQKIKTPNWLFQRTQEARKTVIEAMGGSKKTESAVDAAIRFLAESQEPDGRWTRFTGEPAPGHGRTKRDMGLTGLATMCFLAVNHTPNKPGPYQQHVRKAMDYLLANQKPDGDLRGKGGHMYSHGMASLAVIEAAVMTGDPKYRSAGVKAAQFILNAQNAKTGGWRYEPGDRGDTSILGWQVMALYSVEHLGFKMPDTTHKGALRWLDSVASRTPHRALAGYTDRLPSSAMAAEAAFSRILLGQKLTQAQQKELCDYLLKFEPGKGKNDLFRRDDFYAWYYTALALMQLQNTAWSTWNKQMQKRLLATQRKDGALRGSWDPKTKHSRLGGRVYSTTMATLTLQVYYRYLPTYAKPRPR